MTSASGTQRRSSGPTGAGLAFDLSVRIRRPALHHRETLRPRALLPWLPAVIAPPLKRHVAERLADIHAFAESGA